MKKICFAVFFVWLIAGCGSSTVIRKPIEQPSDVQLSNLKYNIGDVKSDIKDVPEHFISAIKGHLKSELSKRNLFVENSDNIYRVDISVKEYRMRGGFTRAMFGMFAGKDGVNSTITIVDTNKNNVIGESDVSTFNLTAVGGMDDVARMHAEEIAKFLDGMGVKK